MSVCFTFVSSVVNLIYSKQLVLFYILLKSIYAKEIELVFLIVKILTVLSLVSLVDIKVQ